LGCGNPIALASIGFDIYATEHTAITLHKAGLRKVVSLHKIGESEKKPNVLDYLLNGKIKLVVNIPSGNGSLPNTVREDEYAIRRLAVEHGIPVLTTFELAAATVEALQYLKFQEPEVLSISDYVDQSTVTRFLPIPE
jgi:hypothetical protein